MKLLKIENLEKSRQKKKVLDSISLELEPGTITALLGKNGAGKSTLMKMIAGQLKADAGSIEIAGMKPGSKTRALVSYLPEKTQISPAASPKSLIEQWQAYFEDFDVSKAKAMIEELGIDPDMKISRMSKGMKEKVMLVLAMSRNARLYLLDEPLGGIDPATREQILETILKNFSEDGAILVSTHLIADIEPVLDAAIVLEDGRLKGFYNCEEIREMTGLSLDAWFRKECQ